MDLIRTAQRRDVRAVSARATAERQDDLYHTAGKQFGPAMARLATSYEVNPALREDLLQDINFAVWQSFANYRGECALRTWVYRVAHNTAAAHVLRQKRVRRDQWVSVEELDDMPDVLDTERIVDASTALATVQAIIQKLKPVDRDLLLLYLEGFEGHRIAEVVGISRTSCAEGSPREEGAEETSIIWRKPCLLTTKTKFAPFGKVN
jgi:RNA polymerase sigma-70 factor (ECF subfamily)